MRAFFCSVAIPSREQSCKSFVLSLTITLTKVIMNKNIGTTDKIIRLIVAALIAVLYLTNVISGTAGIVLLVLAIVLVATSLVSFCGVYALFGLSTCKVRK